MGCFSSREGAGFTGFTEFARFDFSFFQYNFRKGFQFF